MVGGGLLHQIYAMLCDKGRVKIRWVRRVIHTYAKEAESPTDHADGSYSRAQGPADHRR